jgi:hypothetical protein
VIILKSFQKQIHLSHLQTKNATKEINFKIIFSLLKLLNFLLKIFIYNLSETECDLAFIFKNGK